MFIQHTAPTEGHAWDCDPTISLDGEVEPYDIDLDYEDAEGDYQVLALDRFFDRNITQ